MTRAVLRGVVAAACGVVFAVGLAIGGAADPTRILAFLDVGGAFDPRLVGVMAGALAVNLVAWPVVLRRRPVLADAFALPTRRDVDAPLVVGAALFGVGWGLAGYCAGPALVAGVASTAAGEGSAATYLAALVVGYVGYACVDARRRPGA